MRHRPWSLQRRLPHPSRQEGTSRRHCQPLLSVACRWRGPRSSPPGCIIALGRRSVVCPTPPSKKAYATMGIESLLRLSCYRSQSRSPVEKIVMISVRYCRRRPGGHYTSFPPPSPHSMVAFPLRGPDLRLLGRLSCKPESWARRAPSWSSPNLAPSWSSPDPPSVVGSSSPPRPELTTPCPVPG
jgi:hypothetical protein